MRNTRNIMKAIGLAIAVATMAGSAQAQGRGRGEAKGKPEKDAKPVVARTAGGDVVVVPGNGHKVPPGLAKKPGQMPPGQYKKLYSTAQGASTLSDVLRRNGYTVVRLVPAGDSRYVYYRLSDGTVRRAIVQPGTSQLTFVNVPAAILQAVLARLY